MGIDWANLRPLNKSEREAFEELCCQLAYYESVPDGSRFERKGKPDGGVECFWKFPSGDEWCWQAKFFLNSPSDGQWGQIDESVRTLLTTHPTMIRCTVAMPTDLPDSRIKGQDSAKDKWDKHVKKWQEWGASQGREIEFEYWGEHQFWERLARQEHHGRYFFWFHKEFFSPDWFQKRLAVAIKNAGERYTTKSNVELPITNLFDGLGRTSAFFNRIQMLYGKLKKAYGYTRSDTFPDQVEEKYQALCSYVGQILNVLMVIDKAKAETELDWKNVVQLAEQSLENAWACHETLQQTRQQLSKDREKYDYPLYHLRELISVLREVEEFGQSNEAQLANTAALLLVGEAGKGKTHLLCHIAEQRTRASLPTILLLGQHFVQGNPWAQIYGELGLNGIGNEDEFLGALEAVAQLRGAKALILIDALNEGEGAKIWRNYLPGILQTLSHHPWISLAVSVRSNYEKLIIPDHLTSDKLVRVAHHGFEGHEYQAMQIFFASYHTAFAP